MTYGATATATGTPPCPKCGGPMFDETKSKFYDPTKNRPIAKCKNKGECDGVIWAPKNGNGAAPAPRPVSTTKQPISIGSVPWEEEETGAAPASAGPAARALSAANPEFALYSRCLDQAVKEAMRTGIDKLPGDVAGAVIASAATLFIQAHK